ncbi:MAG: hypothetical protein ABIG61_09040 [Planctomycetota bacterium]
MEKDEIYAELDEFSERVLKLFNGWRESVRATGDKKVLKKIDWLKKFHTYMRRQILNLEKDGKLKEPILPDSMARLSRANFKDRYEYMYKRVGLYARPDQFTKTLLELFEDWRVFFNSTEHKEILKEILEDSGYLECFCRFVEAHLRRLKGKGRLEGRLELRIKQAERLKKQRTSIARIAKEDKFRESLVEFFENWKESVKATGDKEVLDTAGWLKKFGTYVRKQIFSLEKDGRLKEPIISDSMERAWQKKLKDVYKEDRHYVKPDEFTERLLNLFEKVRKLKKELFKAYTTMLANTDWLGDFCSYVGTTVRKNESMEVLTTEPLKRLQKEV